ncbi:hypothetical protein B0H14DRAFT_2577458 [Mycena olivaceomarginata]|nr:hypothetical protein B0H14DRAFT_2577458 [Mycena olivaceomarginata]
MPTCPKRKELGLSLAARQRELQSSLDKTSAFPLPYICSLSLHTHAPESLAPEHISLRLLGNVACQPNTDLGTLGQFFDAHDRIHGNNTNKILQGPPTLGLPSPAVYLEGFISVKDFEDSTGVLAPYFVHTEKENHKRKSSQSSRPMTPDLGSLKRSRTQISVPVPLRSEFGGLPGFSKVPFLFASVSIATNSAVTIAWPNLHDEICAPSICLLQDTAFDQGKTKMVHKVIHDGLPWVAKRFFNIGTGEGLVEIQDNYDQITKEGIKVTEFKLGVDLIPNGSGPSIASGFSMEQYEAAQLDGSAQGWTDPQPILKEVVIFDKSVSGNNSSTWTRPGVHILGFRAVSFTQNRELVQHLFGFPGSLITISNIKCQNVKNEP